MTSATKTPSDARLVLGFDASCAACTATAASISRHMGEKLEVISLSDPEAVRWREIAFDGEPPWVPTLFEVEASTVRAWTGPRMLMRLAQRFTLKETLHIVRAIREVRHNGTLAGTTTSDGTRLTRKSFLMGVGGGAAAVALLGPTATNAAAEEGTSPARSRSLTQEELHEAIVEALSSADLHNVMSQQYRRNFEHAAKARSLDSAAGAEDGYVAAAQHMFNDNSSVLAVAFAYAGQVSAYYSYENSSDSIVSMAFTAVLDAGTITIESDSHNGSTSVAAPQRGRAVGQQCCGCRPGPNPGAGDGCYGRPRNVCRGYDEGCFVRTCAPSCPVTGVPPAVTIACAAAKCYSAFFRCCDYRTVRCLGC